jgi:hypothetical protein
LSKGLTLHVKIATMPSMVDISLPVLPCEEFDLQRVIKEVFAC